MEAPRLVAWERVDGVGHSLGRLERTPTGWRCHGIEVLAGPADPLSCWFRVELDEAWHTREVVAGAVAAAGERTLTLAADDRRRWTVDGTARPDLAGCLDVDVAATPLTNTFPIRRLGALAPGDEVTLSVAWVEVPELRVVRVEQTYRRLPDGWEYRDPEHGPFRLTVDADGLAVSYEDFARRVAG
jgi:uncharacterized protein